MKDSSADVGIPKGVLVRTELDLNGVIDLEAPESKIRPVGTGGAGTGAEVGLEVVSEVVPEVV